MTLSFLEFAREQRAPLPLLVSRETCEGRTYIVTGANVGLGYEVAKHLASFGASKIILAVRNTKAGETAKATIESETACLAGTLEVWPLDLASYGSVTKFAQRATASLERIDGLIENAGVALLNREEAEGQEMTITVNVLSTLLLAVLMMPKLEETAKKFNLLPHLVIVGSEVAWDAKADFIKVKDDPLEELKKADNMMGR